MTKPKITTTAFQIKHGRLRLDTHGVKERYRSGVYLHRLGVVHVYINLGYCRIDTSWGNNWLIQERHDNPTDRQISNFCRKLLTEIHQ